MVYEGVLKGRFVELRSITLDDAQFSFDIRSAPENSETVGVVAKTVEDQRKFIEWQMKEPNDYYFVVYNKKGEKIGLYGIYNVDGDMCEVGREVNIGSCVEVVETEILAQDFAMDVMGMKRICYVIYANNASHLHNQKHYMVKPLKKTVRSGRECFYFEADLSKDSPARRKLAKVGDDFLD